MVSKGEESSTNPRSCYIDLVCSDPVCSGGVLRVLEFINYD